MRTLSSGSQSSVHQQVLWQSTLSLEQCWQDSSTVIATEAISTAHKTQPASLPRVFHLQHTMETDVAFKELALYHRLHPSFSFESHKLGLCTSTLQATWSSFANLPFSLHSIVHEHNRISSCHHRWSGRNHRALNPKMEPWLLPKQNR